MPQAVKLGQALSQRPDVVGGDVAAELALLQDQVAPFSDAAAHAAIRADLGATAHELFAELSPRPVASASLGQVCVHVCVCV